MNSQKGHFYTVSEAARQLAVSPSTIWRWIEAGKLRAFRIGERTIRIRDWDLEAVFRPARERGRDVTMEKERPDSPPGEEEIARRKALVGEILAKRLYRNIAPLTSADLVHKARAWETEEPEEHDSR